MRRVSGDSRIYQRSFCLRHLNFVTNGSLFFPKRAGMFEDSWLKIRAPDQNGAIKSVDSKSKKNKMVYSLK
jgi:hypothetical protein